ncbi:MAG: bifunctional ornithine acetyltransferase/N-acetylglutamate synthase, partial [Thermoguttaceae bacterium]|nr:bifunctional ornithine acetyltransferase/N-acetylglutamate synthase [Thermoguttaceae bacterium]
GMCKGAAMIGPNMATMLCVLMTDATLDPADAQGMLKRCADETFNCISVEGHTSTSDTVLLLANGAGDGQPMEENDRNRFADLLLLVCSELARMIPNDGEGVSHLITVTSTAWPRGKTPRRSPERSPTMFWSRRRSAAPTRTGAESSRPPDAPVSRSTPRR